jgi:hypothetical protein
LLGFDAAERADREAKRAQGPRPEWSIRVALSLIETARLCAADRPLLDPRRAEEDEIVRQVWDRLRLRLLH